MKKVITFFVILCGILVLPEVMGALFLFLFIGKLPGLNIVVNPNIVFIASVIAVCFLLAHTTVSLLTPVVTPKEKPRRSIRTPGLSSQQLHDFIVHRTHHSA